MARGQRPEVMFPLDGVKPRLGLTPAERSDLEARLRRAAAELHGFVEDGHVADRRRLDGKVEGVLLALSYLEEYGR